MLRFPADVGGVLMACPICGRRFAAPFRLAGTKPEPTGRAVSPPPAPAFAQTTADQTPFPPSAPTDPEPDAKPAAPNSHAARVAALYASKS
jgi:hypothetical protein